jgi:hypothetical protein
MEAHAGAAAETEQLPGWGLILSMVALVVIAAIAGVIAFLATDPQLHLNPQGFAVFAPIYVAAQAIERFLEPIASRLNPTNEQKDNVKQAREEKLRTERAVSAAITATPTDVGARGLPPALSPMVAKAAAVEQSAIAALRLRRSERRVIWWAVASAIGLVLAGFAGLGILEAMSTKELKPGLGAIDVVLTGLVIGGGTKPLHDLITRLEKAKDNADPATKPTGTPPIAAR